MVNKLFYYCIAFGFILVLILGGIIFYESHNQDLEVVFLDVGQGDAILISQGKNQMLVDGGKNGKLTLEKLGKYVPFWDRTIEILLATHPDQDHIGGLIDVLKSYKVGAILETRAESDSETYKAWKETSNQEGAQNIEAIKDVKVKFANGSEAHVLYPFSSIENSNKSSNNQYSVVIKLTVGQDSFLFTGDLPKEKELALISEKLALNSRVLKVAHHGSKYSTNNEFLEAALPEEAIISVGKNNAYGHPAPEIIDRLLLHGVKILRTDEMGDIVYKCKVESLKCKVEF
jgi:competence protein ComEC